MVGLMARLVQKIFFFISVAIFIFAIALFFQFSQFRAQPINLKTESIVFEIKPGSNIKTIAKDLRDQSLIEDHWLLIILAKLEGVETKIKAGEYRLKPDMTPMALLDEFVNGSPVQYQHTIIEGRSFKEMRASIYQNDVLLKTTEDMTGKEIMTLLGQPDMHPEGQFLPDTYSFPKGTSDVQFMKRAHQSMQKVLQDEWQKRDKNLPLETPYEALILASIIEKETGAAHERPLIASAFIQRLKKNMKLQTDPTIIYGMGDEYQGDIRYKDLRKDTPYNTYIHRGLTPTPIAMPGKLAIQAALHPADSKAIYFVSKGDGTHYFSETLQEHNKAVRKYQLKGRKPKRKAQSGE